MKNGTAKELVLGIIEEIERVRSNVARVDQDLWLVAFAVKAPGVLQDYMLNGPWNALTDALEQWKGLLKELSDGLEGG